MGRVEREEPLQPSNANDPLYPLYTTDPRFVVDSEQIDPRSLLLHTNIPTTSYSTTMDASSARAAWEGLGGPIQIDDHRAMAARLMDPTLDSCCQRDMEDSLRAGAFRSALQRHDVVAERERRRRHLVEATGFQGCRCQYDPQVDGGDYLALNALRTDIIEDKVATDSLFCMETQNGNFTSTNKPEESPVHENDKEDEDSDDEFDYLLDEDVPGASEELKVIEEQRRAELETEMLHAEIQLQHGYGVHRQMHPTRALKAAGLASGTRDPPPVCVVHLFDSMSEASARLDIYLESLAQKERGTRFLRSDGRMTLALEKSLLEKALPRFQIDMIPCVLAIKDGSVVNVAPLQQFMDHRGRGEDGELVTEAVHDWLRQSSVLHDRPPPLEALCRIRPEEEALLDYLVRDAPPKEEDIYCCGVPGCQKTFMHQHVGVATEQQSGLVVPESDIIGTSGSDDAE